MLGALLFWLPWQEPPAAPPPAAPAASERFAVRERVLLTVPEEFAEARLVPSFAPDGSRAAVAVFLPEGRAALLAEGADPAPHDALRLPQFSADGKHLAWAWGDRAKKDRVEWELWLDGKRVKKADWLGTPVFATVGDDYAIWSGKDVRLDGDGNASGGEYTCAWGRKKADGYSDPPWQDPQWSADGRHLGFIARKPSRSVVVLDGKEYGPYYFASGLTWSADGRTAAWSATKDFDRTLIFTARQSYGEAYESCGAPALGPEGSMAYLARVRGRAALVFREEIVPGYYDDLGTPAISPDGRRVAVAANTGRKQLSAGWYLDNSWMDGSENADEDAQALAAAGSKCFLLVDGRAIGGEWWRVVRPVFSPDSRHVAARVRNADGWQILLDERVSPAYDEVSAPRFSEDGKKVRFGARRGREIFYTESDS